MKKLIPCWVLPVFIGMTSCSTTSTYRERSAIVMQIIEQGTPVDMCTAILLAEHWRQTNSRRFFPMNVSASFLYVRVLPSGDCTNLSTGETIPLNEIPDNTLVYWVIGGLRQEKGPAWVFSQAPDGCHYLSKIAGNRVSFEEARLTD